MSKLKQLLLSTGEFVDNEYLTLYVELIENNFYTKKESKKTQQHHIIPKCYFTIRNMPVDNSPQNKVNLLYKDHVLAHCYIALSSIEDQFKYFNFSAVRRLIGHRDFKDLKEIMESLEEFQMAYESSIEVLSVYNPMFRADVAKKHSDRCKTEEFRNNVSTGMVEYRKNNTFTEEHRKNLSIAMKGNHNWGTGDTRSIGCYCVDNEGNRTDFHSYKDGTVWWFDNYKPFGDKYVLITLQRKIRQSVETGEEIAGLTWYKI